MRLLAKVIILNLLLLILLIPIILLNQNIIFRKTADILFFIHRGLGLYAFSLIFIAIVLGSAMNIVDRFFPADKVFGLHKLVGKLAFTLVILHPIFLYSTYLVEGNLNYVLPFQEGSGIIYFSLGILALLLLTISVGAALLRFKIGIKWLYIHRLNYLIFWLIFFHSLNLGIDTQTSFAKSIYIAYGTVVAILTIRKFLS